ncbi:hypothetical protein B0I33_107207 [Prauserella shujinwangii]|uniref:Uncharacterized protein n=1 Tax=Prauserella shujinwangii TaxID=1453103 RepID=A0A2T0LSI3_9PSEU|nr:hypothetical protein [Prauserella shujinwangii]PRX46630.1 hypothetical protein B0I33_107207 [Prauserella shujinwangii]
MTARRVFAIWLATTVAGAVLLALPDSSGAVVRISERHGPGVVDVLGMVVVLAGSAVLWWHLIRHRGLVVRGLGGRATAALLTTLVLALALVAWSVLADIGWWWVAGAGCAWAAQLVALRATAHPRSASAPGSRPR